MKKIWNKLLVIIFCFMMLISCKNIFFQKLTGVYTVTFETNGGTEIATMFTTYITFVPIPEKDNCSFMGWYDNSSFIGEPIVFPLTLDKDITLYAKYLQNFEVTFITNCDYTIESLNSPSIQELPIPVKENFEFVGWYTKSDCSGNAIACPYELKNNITLYAKWLPSYVISFETNGGSEISSFRTRLIENLQESEKTKHSFAGWYKDKDLTIPVTYPLVITEDTKVYAKWKEKFTVSFECNGGSYLEPITTYELLEIPESTLQGKTLEGWYADSKCSEENRITFPLTVTQDIILYANWVTEMWTITYDSNGATTGTVPAKINVEKGKSFIVSSNVGNLQKTDFAFTNWSTSTDGESGQTYTVGQTITPSKNMTLYVQWGNDYTAMVTVEGGSFYFGEEGTTRPKITLDSFQIAKYEVTYELWLEVTTWARENGYVITSAKKGYAKNDQYKTFVPATNISWNEACVWLNAYSQYKGLEPVYYRSYNVWKDDTSTSGKLSWYHTKNGYRLPTECEWEYAAGGGNKVETRTTFAGSNSIYEVAWYCNNSGKEMHPVGTKKPNQLGIYDMSGSATEWCFDTYSNFGYGELYNPIHYDDSYRVIRGGNIKSGANYCTVFYRNYDSDIYYTYPRGIRPARNAE